MVIMYSIERKSEIANILENAASVDVSFLAKKFGISKETIRLDLREMENDGLIKRTHGGAVLNHQKNITTAPEEEEPITIRGIQRYREKNQICKCAASYIEDGDTIFVDNSSTTMYLTKYISPNAHVTIITNSIKILLETANEPNFKHILVCLGGMFNSRNLSVYGSIGLKDAEKYYPNKAFMSCAGISPQNILADSSIYEIDTKRMMIERAPQIFMLADYTKFRKASQIFLCNISDVNYLITDNKVDMNLLNSLDQTNLKVVIAQPNNIGL
jgi:DeoR family transcriptional regulator, fructose operon transcriptional repressor